MAKENPGFLTAAATDLRLISDDGEIAEYGQRPWVRWLFGLVLVLCCPFLLHQAWHGWTLGGVPYLLEIIVLAVGFVCIQQILRRCQLRIVHDGWLEVEAGYWGIRPITRRVDLRTLVKVDYEPCRVRRFCGAQAQVIDGVLVVLELEASAVRPERLELVAFGDRNLADLLGRTIHSAAMRARGFKEPHRKTKRRRRVKAG